MKKPNSIRRTIRVAAALVVLGALAGSATGCASARIAPASAAAQPPALSPAPAAAPTPASASAAAPPASTARVDPAIAEGKAVVQSSCIGRCHRAGLLDKRYSAPRAKAVAADMGRSVGLSSAQTAAVAAYFAQ